MKQRKIISLVLALILIFSMAFPITSSAVSGGTHAAKSTILLNDNDVRQEKFTAENVAAYYKIIATDTQYYKFTFDNQSVEARTGISIADNLLNLFFGKIDIEITDQYDLVLANFSVRCGYSGNVSLKLTKDATYYIKVTANLIGNYRIKVNSYADIGGDSWETATETLSVGQLISSIDASGDKDWFYFQTDDTDSFYNFSLENISGSSSLRMYVYEYVEGAGQTPLRDTFNISASHSYTTTKELKLKPNTKYFVCIYLSSGIGGYKLDIVQTLDAVGDTQEVAYKVDPDTKVTTALDGVGDLDFYKFTTKDYDAYYYFNIDSLSVSVTWYLYLYDANGNKIEQASAWTGSSISLDEKLLPNTEYYFAIEASSGGKGNYCFEISDIPDNFANTQEEAGEIALDKDIYESISGSGDIDYFKFTTKNYDAYYYFSLDSLSISTTWYVYLYDASGNKIKQSSAWSGSDFSLNEKLLPNTEYYFAIDGGKGNYKVTVTDKQDYYPNTIEQAKQIDLNKDYSASITGDGDIDYFKIAALNKNAYYHIELTSLSVTTTWYLYVYDSQGNKIDQASAWSGANFSIDVKMNPNSYYYFAIDGGKGNYKVKVTYNIDAEGEDKYEAFNIKTNDYKTYELSSNDDVDWFKFTLNYDTNIRVVATNESGNRKYIDVYSSVDKCLISSTCYSGMDETKILDAGDYYVKVTGNKGFYSFAIGSCGSSHIEASRYVSATNSTDGIKTTYCKSCKKTISKEVIPKIDKVSLSYTKTTYSGKVKKPSVTVYDSKGEKIPSSQYDLSYSSGRVNVGSYTVTVKFKGKYSGTKTAKFNITTLKSSKLKLKLSKTIFTYDGKVKKPTVTVKMDSKKISSSSYTVYPPSSAKKIGSYKIKVVLKGNYSGTEYLTFKIVPQKSSFKKLSAGKKSLKIKLSKVSSASGYEIEYSLKKNFKSSKKKTTKSTSYTIKSLKSKKTYYVRVRSYKTVGGKKFYSDWSSVKSKKTK